VVTLGQEGEVVVADLTIEVCPYSFSRKKKLNAKLYSAWGLGRKLFFLVGLRLCWIQPYLEQEWLVLFVSLYSKLAKV
jgi:hypothetical protein